MTMRFVSSGYDVVIRVICLLICMNKAKAHADATLITSRIGVTGAIVSNLLRGGRELSTQTITTPNCNAVRTLPYSAELQLFYSYSVEFNNAFSLTDIERAIANAVALQLDMCDVQGRPVYKVKTIKHSFSNSGVCVPVVDQSNTCIVVMGETAILLDNDSDATFLTTLALEAIGVGLSDQTFLEGFTDDVIQAALISSGHASLVETSDYYGDNGDGDNNSDLSPITVTATVAVAAASVSIVVASIFCYGFMRTRPPSEDPSVRHRRNRSYRKPNSRTVISSSIGTIGNMPPYHRFVRLEDLSASSTSFVTASISPNSDSNTYNQNDFVQEDYTPHIPWNVSDITSDSASLRSGISRTPSMLERIEEEVEEEEEGFKGIDDNHSCDFSYSEDSNVTITLSERDISHNYYCDDGNYRSPNDKIITDFDCRSLRQDQVLDISDLDACFIIASIPHKSEKSGYDDLNYSSSHCTEESLLEITSVDMNIAAEDSMGDSDETSVRGNSTLSMVALDNLTQLDAIQNSTQNLSTGQNGRNDLKYNNEDFFLSAKDEENSARMSKLNTEVEEEKVELVTTSISQVSSFSIDEGSSAEKGKEYCTMTVTSKTNSTLKVALSTKNNTTLSEIILTNSNDEMEISQQKDKHNESFYAESQDKKLAFEYKRISSSSCCTRGDEINGSCTSDDGIDMLDIVAVDSIDLWVSELMEE